MAYKQQELRFPICGSWRSEIRVQYGQIPRLQTGTADFCYPHLKQTREVYSAFSLVFHSLKLLMPPAKDITKLGIRFQQMNYKETIFIHRTKQTAYLCLYGQYSSKENTLVWYLS